MMPPSAKKSSISTRDNLQLKFMETVINRVNTCLSKLYTIEKILVEKKIISEKELVTRIKEDRKLPAQKFNARVLQDMIDEYQETYPSVASK